MVTCAVWPGQEVQEEDQEGRSQGGKGGQATGGLRDFSFYVG